jgi:hypothetical protein
MRPAMLPLTLGPGLTPNMSGGFGVAKQPRGRPLDGLVRPQCVLTRQRPLMNDAHCCSCPPKPSASVRLRQRPGNREFTSGGSLPAAELVAPHERHEPSLMPCNARCADRQRTGSPHEMRPACSNIEGRPGALYAARRKE